MADTVTLKAINIEAVRDAMALAPTEALRYVRSEMLRFGKRFKKKFIRERMSGRPGIRWGNKVSIGKNVNWTVTGYRLEQLVFKTNISRFLRDHEEGATIVAKKHPYLYLRDRRNAARGKGRIFAAVKQVVIPARLGFQPMAIREINADLVPRIENAMDRAIKSAFERKFKGLQRIVGQMAA